MLVLKTKRQKLERVVFSPDGAGLAAAGQQGAYWWQSFHHDPNPVRFGEKRSGGVGVTPDGMHLITAVDGMGLGAINLTDQSQHVVPVSGFEPSVSVCPVTGLAVTEPVFGGEVTGWQLGPDGTLTRAWVVSAGPGSIGSRPAFARDGAWFVRPRQADDRRKYRLVLHDPATGLALHSVPGSEWVSCGPAVSPDKEWIAFGTGHHLFAQSTDDPDRHFFRSNENTHQFTGMSFHPSGQYLAATNNDTTVKLYDTATWQVAKTFTWNVGRLRSVAFSPDGMLAAVGSDTGKIVVWDVDL